MAFAVAALAAGLCCVLPGGVVPFGARSLLVLVPLDYAWRRVIDYLR